MNNWQELNKLWNEYFHLSVYKNEHLVKLLLHYWLGIYLSRKYKILYSGYFRTLRVHPFIIQNSGTGKSVAMKSCFWLLKDLGYDVMYTTTTTDASLVGTVYLMGKEVRKEYGLLKSKEGIIWDEGSILLKGGPYSENLCDILQMALDEPGYITKGLRLGTIEFRTSTSICAGSYPEDNIDKTMLKRGLFQRMLVSFYQYTEEEIKDFIIHQYSITTASYAERKQLSAKIAELLALIQSKDDIVYINIDDYRKFCQHFLSTLETAMGLFRDKKQEIFTSFYTRNLHLLAIAAQKCVVEGRNEIDYEDLVYGFEVFRDHLKSVNGLLIRREKQQDITDEKRLHIIKQALSKKPKGIYELRDYLVSLDKSIWELGESNTYKVIKRFISVGFLKVEVGERNKNILRIS